MVDEKSESELNLFVQEKLPAKFASGYLDLADKGRFELEKIPAGRIDLPGSSIFSQGALFTITNNNIESKKPSAIKIMTAEKQIKLQLPDGSRVTLNKNSFISFPSPFDPEQRMVSLKGEALFEVESNPNAPFVVQLINKAKVQAYGTVFTVNCYGKDSYTTLLRGHVTVTTDGQTKTLWEGEQVKITEGVQGFSVEKANPEKAISWTCKSEFELKNVGFKQMMLEIGRWFGYPVSFQGEMPHGNHKIKLNEDTSLDFLIETIEENDKVTIQKTTDNKLIVMSK
jgi:ferric-dicitrate binding protein FerR (iron transport regulator)